MLVAAPIPALQIAFVPLGPALGGREPSGAAGEGSRALVPGKGVETPWGAKLAMPGCLPSLESLQGRPTPQTATSAMIAGTAPHLSMFPRLRRLCSSFRASRRFLQAGYLAVLLSPGCTAAARNRNSFSSFLAIQTCIGAACGPSATSALGLRLVSLPLPTTARYYCRLFIALPSPKVPSMQGISKFIPPSIPSVLQPRRNRPACSGGGEARGCRLASRRCHHPSRAALRFPLPCLPSSSSSRSSTCQKSSSWAAYPTAPALSAPAAAPPPTGRGRAPARPAAYVRQRQAIAGRSQTYMPVPSTHGPPPSGFPRSGSTESCRCKLVSAGRRW